MTRVPTAALAAIGLLAGFGVAVASGSRPLGGVVLAVFGLACIAIWVDRHGPRAAGLLTAVGLSAFALSHLLGLLIGAWPAVTVVTGAMAAICWAVSDSPHRLREAGDRPHAIGSRGSVAADQDRLDPRRPGTSHVLIETVPEMHGVPRRDSG
jgi:hypothetical protein